MEKGKLKMKITRNKLASGLKTFVIKAGGKTKRISFKIFWQDDMKTSTDAVKQEYVKYRVMTSPDGSMSKITHQVTLAEARQYLA